MADVKALNATSSTGSHQPELLTNTSQDYMQHMTSALILLYLCVFVAGIVGNLLVCLSVYRNKSLQTVTNYYIVNLAVADFLVILICLPPTLYWDLTLTWNFGLVLCKLVPYLQSISVSVSVLTLTCISLDRCYAICRPLEFSSTKGRAKKTIALVWLSSALFASPDLVYLTTKRLGGDELEPDEVYMDCAHSWPEQNTRIYQLCISALLFLLPLVLMSVSYWHIVNVLWRSDGSLEASMGAGERHREPSNEINCHLSAQSIPANDQSAARAATSTSSRDSQTAPVEMRPVVMFPGALDPRAPPSPSSLTTKAPPSPGATPGRSCVIRARGGKNLHQQWRPTRMGSTNQSSKTETTTTTTTIGNVVVAAANGPLYGLATATKSAGPLDAANGATHGADKAEAAPANDAPMNGGDGGGGGPQPDADKGAQRRCGCRRWWRAKVEAGAPNVRLKTSRRYRKNLANYAAKFPSSGGTDELVVAAPASAGSSSNNAQRFGKLIESRKKAAKMLIVIVIMFALCYLPVHFLNVLRYTAGLPQNDLTQIASLVSHWLCYFNSAVNPLIYNLMSGKFRREFANLFCCRCFRRRT